MAGSVNKVFIAGNLGNDPEIRNMQSGDKVANLSIATSESWKDKSGERQQRVQWHRVYAIRKGNEVWGASVFRCGAKNTELASWWDENPDAKVITLEVKERDGDE